MIESISDRLFRLGIELPEASRPGANYVPFVRTGSLLFLTGQLCHWNGEKRFIGKLGSDFKLDEGQAAARICALNLVAQLQLALDGDWTRFVQLVRVGGFVNSTPEFTAQSQVLNGASDLFLELFGESGKHTRIAVGVSALPYNVAVEVEAVVEVR
jgi:enamine deaminase RidA (YjgF/YER057c/UK114 family)